MLISLVICFEKYCHTLALLSFMERECAIASLQFAITETDRAFKEKNFRFTGGNDFLR